MVLELVCGADFWCNRHCRTSPVVLEGLGGQIWPNIGTKPAQQSDFRIANEPLSDLKLRDIRHVEPPPARRAWIGRPSSLNDPNTNQGITSCVVSAYLDSEQETKIYILIFLGFGGIFGHSWAQEPAQRPRLEKHDIDQRKLTREIDSKAPKTTI